MAAWWRTAGTTRWCSTTPRCARCALPPRPAPLAPPLAPHPHLTCHPGPREQAAQVLATLLGHSGHVNCVRWIGSAGEQRRQGRGSACWLPAAARAAVAARRCRRPPAPAARSDLCPVPRRQLPGVWRDRQHDQGLGLAPPGRRGRALVAGGQPGGEGRRGGAAGAGMRRGAACAWCARSAGAAAAALQACRPPPNPPPPCPRPRRRRTQGR
jgi:hypothetical protein